MQVVLGGCHVSSVMSEVLKKTEADMAAYGEAEQTVLDLCLGKDLKKIKGLIYVEGNKIITNPAREPVQDLDQLPFPDYEQFELEKYNLTIDKSIINRFTNIEEMFPRSPAKFNLGEPSHVNQRHQFIVDTTILKAGLTPQMLGFRTDPID